MSTFCLILLRHWLKLTRTVILLSSRLGCTWYRTILSSGTSICSSTMRVPVTSFSYNAVTVMLRWCQPRCLSFGPRSTANCTTRNHLRHVRALTVDMRQGTITSDVFRFLRSVNTNHYVKLAAWFKRSKFISQRCNIAAIRIDFRNGCAVYSFLPKPIIYPSLEMNFTVSDVSKVFFEAMHWKVKSWHVFYLKEIKSYCTM